MENFQNSVNNNNSGYGPHNAWPSLHENHQPQHYVAAAATATATSSTIPGIEPYANTSANYNYQVGTLSTTRTPVVKLPRPSVVDGDANAPEFDDFYNVYTSANWNYVILSNVYFNDTFLPYLPSGHFVTSNSWQLFQFTDGSRPEPSIFNEWCRTRRLLTYLIDDSATVTAVILANGNKTLMDMDACSVPVARELSRREHTFTGSIQFLPCLVVHTDDPTYACFDRTGKPNYPPQCLLCGAYLMAANSCCNRKCVDGGSILPYLYIVSPHYEALKKVLGTASVNRIRAALMNTLPPKEVSTISQNSSGGGGGGGGDDDDDDYDVVPKKRARKREPTSKKRGAAAASRGGAEKSRADRKTTTTTPRGRNKKVAGGR